MKVGYEEMEMDPNKWEELINKIFRIRYKEEGYQYIPARDGGDYGIEGYTETGIVYQCYYPEGEYSPADLYEKLRDKMTKDIQKLQDNQEKLKKLGITNIKEWNFVIPKYEDKKILVHANKKEQEMLKLREEGKIGIIDINFKIFVRVLDDYLPEIGIIIKTNKDYKFLLPKLERIDFSACDSEKKANISRKILTLRKKKDDEKSQRMINLYIQYYIKGIEMLNEIRNHSPELYEEILGIENTYRNNIEMKCAANTDNSINQKLFSKILDDFEEQLKEELGDFLTYSDIGELKQEMIGKWLADCPLDFAD